MHAYGCIIIINSPVFVYILSHVLSPVASITQSETVLSERNNSKNVIGTLYTYIIIFNISNMYYMSVCVCVFVCVCACVCLCMCARACVTSSQNELDVGSDITFRRSLFANISLFSKFK